MAVAPGGTGGKGIALVANLDSNTVTPVDLGTWRAAPPIPVGAEPVAITVFAPASGAATAFVADFGSNSVTPIDVATLQAGAPIAVGPGPADAGRGRRRGARRQLRQLHADADRRRRRWCPARQVPLPLNPTGIAVAASGATAYVCGGAALVPVTVVGLVVGAPVALPDAAQGVALSADGTTAWVTQQAGSLIPVTLATGAVGQPLRLGGHPSAIVIGSGSQRGHGQRGRRRSGAVDGAGPKPQRRARPAPPCSARPSPATRATAKIVRPVSGGMPVPQLNAASARSQLASGTSCAAASAMTSCSTARRSSLINGSANANSASKRGSPLL